MKNKYVEIKYGEGKELITRDEALKYAYGTVIPKKIIEFGSRIVGKPQILEGKKEGLMYVQITMRD